MREYDFSVTGADLSGRNTISTLRIHADGTGTLIAPSGTTPFMPFEFQRKTLTAWIKMSKPHPKDIAYQAIPNLLLNFEWNTIYLREHGDRRISEEIELNAPELLMGLYKDLLNYFPHLQQSEGWEPIP